MAVRQASFRHGAPSPSFEPDWTTTDSSVYRISQNEYAEEIRELRSREKPGRAHAKVFVKSELTRSP